MNNEQAEGVVCFSYPEIKPHVRFRNEICIELNFFQKNYTFAFFSALREPESILTQRRRISARE